MPAIYNRDPYYEWRDEPIIEDKPWRGDDNLFAVGDEVMVVGSRYPEIGTVKRFKLEFPGEAYYIYEVEFPDVKGHTVVFGEWMLLNPDKLTPKNPDTDYESYLKHNALPEWVGGWRCDFPLYHSSEFDDDDYEKTDRPHTLDRFDKIIDFYYRGRRCCGRTECEYPEQYFVKHRFPMEMSVEQIADAIKAAYRNAKRIPFNQYKDEDISEFAANNVRQREEPELILFEGAAGNMTIRFWYNLTKDYIEAAYPVGEKNVYGQERKKTYVKKINRPRK